MKLLIGIILLPYFTFAGYKYHSENLTIMDIESIERIVSRNLAKARQAKAPEGDSSFASQDVMVSESEGMEALKDAVKLIFARPEQNASTSLVFTNISSASEEYGGLDQVLTEVADDALGYLEEDGSQKELLKAQNTSIYILNNMMEELKPIIKDNSKPKITKLVKKIRDKDIDFSSDLKSHRLLHSMKQVLNPSKMAREIIGEKKKAWWKFW